MSQDQGDIDRSEPATAHKLEKARRRGSIFRSADVTFAVILLTVTGCVYGVGAESAAKVARLLALGLHAAGAQDGGTALIVAVMGRLAAGALAVLAAPLLLIWTAAFIVSALQARGVFTSEPLKPDFSRLNPAAGLKRMINVRAIHEVARSLLKLLVLTGAVILWGYARLDDLVGTSRQSPGAVVATTISLIASALALCAWRPNHFVDNRLGPFLKP